MTRKFLLSLAVLALTADISVPSALAGSPDRLERFRALAASRLGLAQAAGGNPQEAYRDMYALVDEEVVESLATGWAFASPEFVQLRLDGFADTWGGATFRLTSLGSMLVGAFDLSDGPGGGSVRVYGAPGGEAQLLAVLQREGRPTVHALSPTKAGAAQFLVAWVGAASGRGTRDLRLDLARQRKDDVTVTWSTTDLFPDGVLARDWGVSSDGLRIRYELHYPGWTPGCSAQTEQEDAFRLDGESGTFVRVRRTQHDAWHLAFRRLVSDLFAALGRGDGNTLARLVPDADLRRRLPTRLEPEPACDAPDASDPATVSIAAIAEYQPWTLTFQRGRNGWRLAGATPVLP